MPYRSPVHAAPDANPSVDPCVRRFSGLFVSFPFLFIVGKIRGELKQEDLDEAKKPQTV